jgi:hypothetical protein
MNHRLAVLLALATACGRENLPPAPEPLLPAATGPTWAEDVAPILIKNCVGCHREGEVAPFALTRFEDASSRAALIAAVTTSRKMPPFNADNSGKCNTFKNALWLSDAEIATLKAWSDNGALEGDLSHAPKMPEPAPLMAADAVATMDVPYTPAVTYGGGEDYRCFVVDPKLTADGYLTAFQVVPGERRIVHHLGVFQLDSAQSESQAAALDAQDALAGYPCMGGPRVAGKLLFAAGPGQTQTSFPNGTGIKVQAGRKIILQMHYHLVPNTPLPDQSSIRLQVANAVAQEAAVVGFGTNDIYLAPKQPDATASFTAKLWWLSKPAMVYGATPHMHTLGTRFEGDVVRATGETQCIIDVPRWNFGMQQLETYSNPLVAYPNDVLRGTCHYDTTSRTKMTTWGETSDDEMCALWFYVVP